MTGPQPMLDGDQPLTYLPRHAFVWQGRGLTLSSQRGQAGALVRAAAGAALDTNGVSLNIPPNVARWERGTISGAERVGLMLDTDLLSWDTLFAARGLGGMIEFIEAGTIGIAGAGLVYCGNDAKSGARWYIDVTGGQYRFTHHNGTSPVTATMTGTAPTNGQQVRLRWKIEVGTGEAQLWQSINGATETTPGLSAGGLSFVAWGTTQRLRINSVGTTNLGSVLALGLAVAIGTPTQAQLLAALAP
jgi:hypothetical protein